MNNIRLDKISLNIALSLLMVVFSLFMLTSLGFILGLSINLSYMVLAIVAMVYLPSKIDSFTYQERVISLIITSIIIVLTGYLSSRFMDYSFDGQTYHQVGVIFLKKGWNPVYRTAETFLQQHWNIELDVLVWLNGYPKFYEIVAANLYYLTDNVETGKTLNFLSAFGLFFYAFNVFDKTLLKNKKTVNLIFSGLLVCNPIVFEQIYTYYTDGLMYIYFMLLLLSVLDYEYSLSKTAVVIMIMSALMLSNIKFGGFLYTLLIAIIYMSYLFYHKKKDRLKRSSKLLGAIFVLIVLTGINPYITNVYNGKHFLYPLAGEEKIDIITDNQPKQFHHKSMLYKFFMSTFSRVDNIQACSFCVDRPVELKIPFTIHELEAKELNRADVRLSGFGVFWSGILLLTLVLAFFIKRKKIPSPNLLPLGILLVSVFINPENWWARYVPQFYAVPLFVGLYYLLSNASKLRYAVAAIFCILILGNSAMIYNLSHNTTKNYTIIKSKEIAEREAQRRTPNFIENLEKQKSLMIYNSEVLIFLDKYHKKQNLR